MAMDVLESGAVQVSLRLILSNASRAMLFLMFVSPAFADACYTVGGTQTKTLYGGTPYAVTATFTVPANVLLCGGAPPFIDPLTLVKIELTGAASFTVDITLGLVSDWVCQGCWTVTLYIYGGTCQYQWTGNCAMTFGFPYVIKKNDYSITLSGGATTMPWQPSTDPKHDHPESNISYQVVVKDQNYQPKANIKVTITTDVTDNSGGHMHTAVRPKGRLKAGTSVATLNGVGAIIKDVVTDGNGVFAFTFGAEEAAGIHTITANCEGCTEAVSLTADVKVDKLAPIPASPFYSFQLPNRDTNHPNTNFLTGTSSKKLGLIANLYYAETYYQSKKGVIPDFVLNDASLEWGGVLDCFLTCNSAMYPSTPWHKAHTEHRRGSVVDVKANGSPGSIVYEKKFREIAAGEGVEVGNLHGSGGGLHYHLRLNNGAKE